MAAVVALQNPKVPQVHISTNWGEEPIRLHWGSGPWLRFDIDHFDTGVLGRRKSCEGGKGMDGSNSGPESSGPFRGFQFEPGVCFGEPAWALGTIPKQIDLFTSFIYTSNIVFGFYSLTCFKRLAWRINCPKRRACWLTKAPNDNFGFVGIGPIALSTFRTTSFNKGLVNIRPVYPDAHENIALFRLFFKVPRGNSSPVIHMDWPSKRSSNSSEISEALLWRRFFWRAAFPFPHGLRTLMAWTTGLLTILT